MFELKRHKHTLISFVIYFLIVAGNFYAQNYNIKFNRLTIEEGLSQSVVTDVMQDSKGFIWIATQDGLNRYDGYDFKIFRNDRSDTTSLCNNYVSVIFEDSDLNLWVGTNGGGLSLFNREKENFSSFRKNDLDQNSISGNFITSIAEDQNGNLWFGTYFSGLNKLVKAKNNLSKPAEIKFEKFFHDASNNKSISSNSVYRITPDYFGQLWIGTLDGLNLLTENKNEIIFKKFFEDERNKFSINDNYIRCFLSDSKGNLWVGTDSGGVNIILKEELQQENPANIKFRKIESLLKKNSKLSGISTNDLYEDQEGNIWIGIWGGGINKVNPNTGDIVYFSNSKSDPNSLSNNDMICLLQDKSGMMWAGTYGGGVNLFNPDPKKFSHFKHDPKNKNSISDNLVTAICTDKNKNLWIGTWNGLNKIDPTRKIVKRYYYQPFNNTSLSNNRVMSLHESKKLSGAIWVGTLDEGLNIYNPVQNNFYSINIDILDKQKNNYSRINSVLEDSKGFLWIGTLSGGVIKSTKPLSESKSFSEFLDNIKNLEFTNFESNKDDTTTICNNRIEKIFEDSDGFIWIGTYNGLCLYDAQTNSFRNFNCYGDGKNTSTSYRFASISESKNKDLWFGTWGEGIKHLSHKNKTNKEFSFNTVTENDGLPNNYIHSILSDNNNSIWVATNKGLSKFDYISKTFKNYDQSDGLQSNEFKSGAFVDNISGEMFFGGINGFNSFFPKKIKDSDYLPPVVFTGFKLFNKYVNIDRNSVLPKSINEIEGIVLSHEQYIFSIDFAALNFNSPNKNKYAYLLEGFDKEWNYTDAVSRTAVYTNLDGGNYVFKVKASNNDGVWNEKETTLNITVLPPFWETTWFYVLSSFSLVVFAFMIYKWRLKNVETQKKLLEIEVEERTKELRELDAAKNKFFTILSHDIKGPFNVFMNTSEFLATDVDEMSKEEIKELAETLWGSSRNLYKLLDNLLQWSKIQMGGITISNVKINVKEIIENNITLLKGFAERKDISLKNEIIDQSHIYTDENMLNTVLRNLISNAIKFTNRGGEIKISALKNGTTIRFCISDSGIGISKKEIEKLFKIEHKYSTVGTANEGGSGLGLIICKEFVELTNGNIWIESEKGKGTKVYFTQKKFNAN